MRKGKDYWYRVLAGVVIYLFLLFIWPTPYSYEKGGSSLVRINRITQSARKIWPSPPTPVNWDAPSEVMDYLFSNATLVVIIPLIVALPIFIYHGLRKQ